MSVFKNKVDSKCSMSNVSVHKDYSCTLNQTDIDKGSNKFYIMQILQGATASYLWTRYGRVGENGRANDALYSDVHSAVQKFESMFKSKTGNIWSDRNNFIEKKGKYTLIDLDEDDANPDDNEGIEYDSSDLDCRIQDIISLISDREMMTRTMKQYDIDTKKLPLGKISKKQIETGYAILKKLHDHIEDFSQDDFSQWSSKFWSKIPYSCGYRGTPPLISTQKDIGRYADMLEELCNLEVAGKILNSSIVVDSIYESLKIQITPIDKEDKVFYTIQKYIQNTHAQTHHYKLEVLEAFELGKMYEEELEKEFACMDNHQLLIHGSRMSNFMGILSEGLRIPKSNQIVNGSILGRGCYFADCISKSFNYCCSCETNKIGFILLCDVALGLTKKVTQPTYDTPLKNFNSIFAQGCTEPDINQFETLRFDTDCIVPCGPMKSSDQKSSSFLYNEYVIYDKNRYRFRYLVKLKSLADV